MSPTAEWLEIWKQKKSMMTPAGDLMQYFNSRLVGDIAIEQLEIGAVSFPSGKLVASDGLVVTKFSDAFFQTIPPGSYPMTLCVAKYEEDHFRNAALRLKINDNLAVRFEEALTGKEKLEGFEEGDYYGFDVMAGMGSLMDEKAHQAYLEFIDQWDKERPKDPFYEVCIAPLLSENAKNNPQFQREIGDWLNWTIPGTSFQVPIVSSGFGDGGYPVYFGYDEKDVVCCVVVMFIDLFPEE